MAAGLICGKHGSNVNRIKSRYSVLVYVTSTEDEYQIVVIGSEAGNVSAAKREILENLEGMMSLDVDKSLVGKLIGPGGETVRRISKEYSVAIHFEKEGNNEKASNTVKAYIVGEDKVRTLAAREAIISIISEDLERVAE